MSGHVPALPVQRFPQSPPWLFWQKMPSWSGVRKTGHIDGRTARRKELGVPIITAPHASGFSLYVISEKR